MMRKNMKGLILGTTLLAMFGLTGCSTKTETLTCTNSASESGLVIDSEAVMTFRADKISDIKLTMDIKADSDLMKENWNLVEAEYDTLYAPVDENGVKVSANKDSENKKYTVSIEADLSKATKESLEKYGMSDVVGAEDTLEQAKKDFESEGFTCKK